MGMPTIPYDKSLHMNYGAAIAAVTGCLIALMLQHLGDPLRSWVGPWAPALGAQLSSLLWGVAKEVSDYLINKRHTDAGEAATHGVEPLDIVATALGGTWVALPLVALTLVEVIR